MKKAIFLDKDGTLIPNIPYNTIVEKIALSDHASDGIHSLYQNNFHLIVVSNQAGIAKGYFKESDLEGVRKKLEILLLTIDAKLTGFYFCPHHPKGTIMNYSRSCKCRKPSPGMLLKAAKEHNIDLSSSWMIGDILDDIEAGNRAGCKSILINNGGETLWQQSTHRKPYFIADNINHAARLILTN